MSNYRQDMSEEEKVSYLKALAFILNVEKNPSQEKKDYLNRQAEEIGFPKRQLRSVKKKQKAAELIAELKGIKNIRLKRFILREMIMLAVSDHELTDAEIATIYKIGMEIGLKEEKINDFFLWTAKGIEWQIEGRQLIEEDI